MIIRLPLEPARDRTLADQPKKSASNFEMSGGAGGIACGFPKLSGGAEAEIRQEILRPNRKRAKARYFGLKLGQATTNQI